MQRDNNSLCFAIVDVFGCLQVLMSLSLDLDVAVMVSQSRCPEILMSLASLVVSPSLSSCFIVISSMLSARRWKSLCLVPCCGGRVMTAIWNVCAAAGQCMLALMRPVGEHVLRSHMTDIVLAFGS